MVLLKLSATIKLTFTAVGVVSSIITGGIVVSLSQLASDEQSAPFTLDDLLSVCTLLLRYKQIN